MTEFDYLPDVCLLKIQSLEMHFLLKTYKDRRSISPTLMIRNLNYSCSYQNTEVEQPNSLEFKRRQTAIKTGPMSWSLQRSVLGRKWWSPQAWGRTCLLLG